MKSACNSSENVYKCKKEWPEGNEQAKRDLVDWLDCQVLDSNWEKGNFSHMLQGLCCKMLKFQQGNQGKYSYSK